MYDSPRILEHLEKRFPEPPLFPVDTARREELGTFLDWFNRVWKGPPNQIAAEEQKPDPDQALIAELEGNGSPPRSIASRRSSPVASTSSATS